MPPPDSKPLAPADCPLLTKYGGAEAQPLLDRFAAAAAELAAVAADRHLAPLLHAGRFKPVTDLLDKARDLMAQRRYVVGCIGITQAGKSTTINNVLGEEVCKPGSGDATSSQPSRVVFADRRSVEVEYLTPARFADRRQKLCEAIGLATPEGDDKLLALLDQPGGFRPADGQDPPPRLREDVAHLREFITAAQKYRHRLTDPPAKLADLPYDRRYDYTTHAKGGPGSETLLVREARFRVDNRQIPEDLELCDLPGLDSKRTIDDVVTWEYLPGLNGTFLFVNVGGNLLTEAMLRILQRIAREFGGRLAGRAWIIFNKMDTLTQDHFRPGAQDNIFATIHTLLEKTGVPESQVCFCSKKVWDLAAAGGAAEPGLAARTMSQTPDRPVPPTCPPGLQAAWAELLKDGGIGHVRRLMFATVAEALAAQIRQDVDRLLTQFTAELKARVAAERKRLSMGDSELQAVVTCHNVVLQLRVAMATRPNEFPVLMQEGDRLRQSLAALFDSGSTADLLMNLSAADLAKQFRTHARVLRERLNAELTGDVLERAYDAVAQRLENLPEVPVGADQLTCRDRWTAFSLEDRADDGWRAGLPQFASDDLSGWLARPDGEGVDGGEYLGLMREKIDVAVRQTVHLVRTRLRHRLGQIAAELSLLTGDPEPATAP